MDKLKQIRHMALDMDGTLYLGSRLFPWTRRFLETLRQRGIGYTFLTNNPSRSVADYLAKLAGMGIQATEDTVLTTSLSAIEWLRQELPWAKRLFLLGTPSMVSQFEKAGFEAAADDPADRPDALVVSFDMTLTYDRLCRAAWWASQGIPYIATNPDRVCPTEKETVLVDCGSIQQCIEAATGRRPDKVLGKPDPTMLQEIMHRHGLQPEQMAMVGDRVYTDMAMARNAGATGILVLSGETTRETLQACPPSQAPDYVFENVGTLAAALDFPSI